MAIELITDMVEQDDREWRYHQSVLTLALLEHVRTSAEKLRASGKFWHEKSKRESRKKINKRKSETKS